MAALKSPKQKPEQRSGASARRYTSEHANLFLGALYQQARNDFSIFPRMIRPNMLWNWYTDDVARELQQFDEDLDRGQTSRSGHPSPATARKIPGRIRLHRLDGGQSSRFEYHLRIV